MLYVEITTFAQFCKNFPADRAKYYTLEGLQALFEYWSEQARELDYTVGEALDYDCYEYESARKALADRDSGKLWQLQLALAAEAMEEAGEDPEENTQLLEIGAYDCDPEELEKLAFEELKYHFVHAEQLANGHVFTVNR